MYLYYYKQLTNAKKDIKRLKETNNESKSEYDSYINIIYIRTSASSKQNIDLLNAELAELRAQLKSQGGDLEAVKRAAEEKIYRSKQYNQLKDMLNKKNQLITELRQKIAKYYYNLYYYRYEKDDTELFDE